MHPLINLTKTTPRLLPVSQLHSSQTNTILDRHLFSNQRLRRISREGATSITCCQNPSSYCFCSDIETRFSQDSALTYHLQTH
ncbi:unnamed protein product [Hymenolepis diminuta]|uniref:Uncharacterized protein n=1 Tax=Hymenolepis diminuta TaxID=6216 RepID=A0A564YC13_HYMDI|nr:unnamed protein product [Hymenolepis diminuta]